MHAVYLPILWPIFCQICPPSLSLFSLHWKHVISCHTAGEEERRRRGEEISRLYEIRVTHSRKVVDEEDGELFSFSTLGGEKEGRGRKGERERGRQNSWAKGLEEQEAILQTLLCRLKTPVRSVVVTSHVDLTLRDISSFL